MKITTILGSPRKKGNTNQVLQWVEEAFVARGHEVDRVNITDRKVNGCKGCLTCVKFIDEPGCPQVDDAIEIMNGLLASDRVIYATPIYFWGPTAQMKSFIDRHFCLVTGYGTSDWRSLMRGKNLGLVVTCEDGVENNVELTEELFKRFVDYLQCDYSGMLVIPFATEPEAFGEDVRRQAREFADRLVGTSQK